MDVSGNVDKVLIELIDKISSVKALIHNPDNVELV